MTDLNDRPRHAPIVIAGALSGVAAVGTGILIAGTEAAGAELAARWTARLAFIWFMLAWSASVVQALWPGGWRMYWLRRRRGLGLAFAAVHGLHLVALAVAVQLSGQQLDLPHLLGGGTAYLFVMAMAATSNDRAVRELGIANWRRLHVTGGWLLAAIFALTYAGGLANKPLFSAFALTWIGVVVALKLAKAKHHKTKPAAA
jgi:hypothetical protein